MSVRKALSTAFMELGVVLETGALDTLAEYVESTDQQQEALSSLLDGVEGGAMHGVYPSRVSRRCS
jgi:hypothetical protein